MSKPPIIGLCLKGPGVTAQLENSAPTHILGLRQGDEKLVSVPEALRWEPPPREVQRERALPVLIKARALFKNGMSLIGAIAEAGGARIEAEYARRALRDVLNEPNLLGWSENKFRRRYEIFKALDRAIARCSKTKHRGGWNVTSIRRGHVA